MPGSDAHYPILTVKVAGTELEAGLVREVLVKDNLSTPDTASVKLVEPSVPITSGSGEPRVVDDERFQLGAQLEVSSGSIEDRSARTVFKGVVVALEPEFTASQTSLLLRAYDKTFFLNQEPKSRTFQQMTVADVARKLLGEHGVDAQVTASGGVHDFLHQANESDWAFLQRLARAGNLELLSSEGRVTLGPASRSRSAAVELAHGEGLLEFSPRVTLAQQTQAVEFRFWDAAKAKVSTASKQTAGAGAFVSVGGFTTAKITAASKAKTMVVSGRVGKQEEADARATALAARVADAAIQATGTAHGNPRLKAGEKVAIKGVGTRFSGDYTLSSTTHVYRQGGAYRTKFSIAGRNAGDLVELLRGGEATNGNGGRSWAQGLVVGVVTNTADPDGLGRVRVQFPTLSDTDEGWWARIATAHAGKDRGLFFMPEVGDEVVVGFEQADIRRPYVLGAVFNGRDKPPAWIYGKGKDKELDGSLLVDTPKRFAVQAKDKIVMTSKDNHEFEAGKNAVHKAGQDFTIDAKGASIYKSGKTITIETGAMQKIVVKAGGDLELTAGGPAGKVKITGGSVDITGQMAVNVKAPSLNLG